VIAWLLRLSLAFLCWYAWELYVRAEGLEDAVAQCRMGWGEESERAVRCETAALGRFEDE
jgi:hypothetical protein